MKFPGKSRLLGRSRELFLLTQMAFALMLHIGWPLFVEFQVEKRKRMAKIAFNQLVKERSISNSILICLKILINNYESLPDASILDSRDLNELQNTCDCLVPVQKKIFLLYSMNMSIAVLGSVILPGLSYLMKKTG
ncbi:uncharacterized protein VICG_00214 [Vittaforma corneae ATCC 50505]|uniref:Uncharacterized protein n=1 Tax=Vittaforma corneae (strain ATCC 50505) TaxID=993615 RepID=L2GQJ3_VITCO|nr:uncharacterized protein VICG_00214 [Vittaforma corneae ATCC 50505]ELA42899.1 hypothetical protein VICG_00214 [Vittaforma corneae ATCC 50505]